MNRLVKFLLLFALVVIVSLVIYDYWSGRPARQGENPFRYDIGAFREADPELVQYEEYRQISIDAGRARDLACVDDIIYLLTDGYLLAITERGEELFGFSTEEDPQCFTADDAGNILIGYENYIAAYDMEGNIISSSSHAGERALFTSMAISGGNIFVADAGNRIVRIYDTGLEETGSFAGESGVSDHHGFILPSIHFDIAVNEENELWVVNPGIHVIQNYTTGGRLRRYWGKPSFDPEGFSGCCNPCYIAFLPDGRFVTSEKGLVRIKIHGLSGAFESFVAPPAAFEGGIGAPALAVNSGGDIIALDFHKNSIRFFKKKIRI